MANTATQQAAIPIAYEGATDYQGVYPVVVTFDTAAADLIIYSPDAGKHCGLVGLSYVETSAHNLTIKSGSTTLTTLEFPANSGISQEIGRPLICTAAGEDLIFNVSVVVSTMIAYVIEFDGLEMKL